MLHVATDIIFTTEARSLVHTAILNGLAMDGRCSCQYHGRHVLEKTADFYHRFLQLLHESITASRVGHWLLAPIDNYHE